VAARPQATLGGRAFTAPRALEMGRVGHCAPGGAGGARGVAVRAVQDAGITPSMYITYKNGEEQSHEASVMVDAAPSKCYALWEDREGLPAFIAPLESVKVMLSDEALAQASMPYKLNLLPTLDLAFLAKREVVQDSSITWESMDGFPNRGSVTIVPEGAGAKVTFQVTYTSPDPIALFGKEESLRKDVVEVVGKIMADFKALAEA